MKVYLGYLAEVWELFSELLLFILLPAVLLGVVITAIFAPWWLFLVVPFVFLVLIPGMMWLCDF